MAEMNLIALTQAKSPARRQGVSGKVLLIKPPYFTPWTPPLGIATLKSFLEKNGFSAKCLDFNLDPELWGMHHKYFAALRELEDVSINDGYSKLWWILNAHLLAHINGASADACASVLASVIPLYGIRHTRQVIDKLIPLVDRFFNRLDELINRIDLSAYSVVGTSTYTTSLSASLFILKRVKQKASHILTVMGGGVFADDLALGSENLEILVREFPYVDHIILGEGELLFLKLLAGELPEKRVISIADLNGETLNMRDVPVPDFSDLSNELYHHLTIEGARSCPFQCSFCSETIQWGDYRKKPISLFADQVLELAARHNNPAFFMGDSLMNPYINSFADELIARKAGIVYDGYLRADKPVTNRKFVKTWADSGLIRVRLGIESAARRVLELMDKMTTPEVISEALKSLSSMGIRTTTYWIVGFPGETEQDFQETCDFIKAHHRYIYELEAHPYYYYPYGQVGSRMYQCSSLYPEDVTGVIKFKAWDIVDGYPAREERYDRLRRISAMAAELGLPNIYTMAERFEAEDRWQRLHPLAAEVYGRRQIRRKEAELPEGPVEVFTRERAGDPASTDGKRSSVLCYRASTGSRLDENTLSSSIDALIAHNEMLQMRLQDGRYVASPGELENKKVLFVYDRLEALSITETVKELAQGMRPEPGSSIRVALIKGQDDLCEILLLAHRAIADGKSVTLLFEDLFRIYQQLSHNRDVSLPPVQKSYSEFISLDARGGELKQSHTTIPLSTKDHKSEWVTLSPQRNIVERLYGKSLAQYGLKPTEAVTWALIRSLAGCSAREAQSIDVAADYRCIDASLHNTVGALTTIFRLAPSITPGAEALSRPQKIRAMLSRTTGEAQDEQDVTRSRSILLNLECLLEDPWLGGDQWAPQGFLEDERGPQGAYLIEALPFLTGDRLRVNLKYRDDVSLREPVELIKTGLARELEAILDQADFCAEAKQYWLEEFKNCAPKTAIELLGGEQASTGVRRESFDSSIEKTTLDELQAQCNAESHVILLSALCAVLSRVSEGGDVVIVSSICGQDPAPIRLSQAWDLSFKQLAERVGEKISLAHKHAPQGLEIIAEELASPSRAQARPAFDIACIFNEPVDRLEAQLSSLSQGLQIALEALSEDEKISLRFIYDAGRFKCATIEKLDCYLRSVLREAARDVSTPIGELAVDSARTLYDMSEALAEENFQFY